MRKAIVLLLLGTMLVSACSSNREIKIGDEVNDIHKQANPYIRINALTVYKVDSHYDVIIENDGFVQKYATFESDRKCKKSEGISLIETREAEPYLYAGFDEVQEVIGQPHVDVGSGFYIPAYITQDAFLLCFEIEDEIVVGYYKRDLLTNEIIREP